MPWTSSRNDKLLRSVTFVPIVAFRLTGHEYAGIGHAGIPVFSTPERSRLQQGAHVAAELHGRYIGEVGNDRDEDGGRDYRRLVVIGLAVAECVRSANGVSASVAEGHRETTAPPARRRSVPSPALYPAISSLRRRGHWARDNVAHSPATGADTLPASCSAEDFE